MRWFYAVLALLLLNPSLVVGLDTSEPYIESFLTSLPYRIVYWTRSEVSYGSPYRSFTTARIVHEDGGLIEDLGRQAEFAALLLAQHAFAQSLGVQPGVQTEQVLGQLLLAHLQGEEAHRLALAHGQTFG